MIVNLPHAPCWRYGRIAVEVVTLLELIVPAAWLALQWRAIPAVSPHLHHGRIFLWVMPAFACLVYVLLSEAGLLSHMDILRPGNRLSGLRPIFTAYILVGRMELMAFLAVLSLAMDQTAATGHFWSAKGFITGSITLILLTVLLFTLWVARTAYRLPRAESGG